MADVVTVMVSDDISLPAKFLACRTLGHAWERIEAINFEPTNGGLPLTLVCLRCKSERRDEVQSHTGRLLGRRMLYAEGYLLTRGVHRPLRQDYRLHLLGVALNEIAVRRRRAG